MAENIRGDVVVEPGLTAEYDRVSATKPMLLIGAALILLSAGMFAVPGLFAGPGAGLLAGVAMGYTGFFGCFGAFLLVQNKVNTRRQELSRDIMALREIIVFDEDATADTAVWEAAGLAEEYTTLEELAEPLANARVRTPAQEVEHATRQEQLRALASRIGDLLT